MKGVMENRAGASKNGIGIAADFEGSLPEALFLSVVVVAGSVAAAALEPRITCCIMWQRIGMIVDSTLRCCAAFKDEFCWALDPVVKPSDNYNYDVPMT